MDYERYIARLGTRLAPMAGSEEYEFQATLYPGIAPPAIAALETAIRAEDGLTQFQIPDEMKRFYTAANGVYIHWVHRGDRLRDQYPSGGHAHIPYLPQLFETTEDGEQREQAIFDRLHVFDTARGDNQVSVRFRRDQLEPEFYYFDPDSGRTYPLDLDLPSYLERLLETRGLGWWQEFFIADPSFRVDSEKEEWFHLALQHFCPDVDLARYAR